MIMENISINVSTLGENKKLKLYPNCFRMIRVVSLYYGTYK